MNAENTPENSVQFVPLQNKSEFTIVCCNEHRALFDELNCIMRPLCNDIHYFQDSNSCLNYIQTLHVKERTFLITSFSFTSIADAQKLRQVDTIFIWNNEETSSSQATNEIIMKYSKVVVVSTDVQQLAIAIEKASIELTRQADLFNLYNHKQKSFNNLSESSASFLWFQLYKIMLISTPQEELNQDNIMAAKKLMIKQCTDYYRHNQTQLRNIDLFNKTYTSSNAINWYTRDTFVYKLINKALRTEDIEVLHTFRYFIIDLCANLAAKHKEMFEHDQTVPSVVYRGTQMNKTDIDQLYANKGRLVGTNGFLSTTRDCEVAKMYAGFGVTTSIHRGELHAVIYEFVLPSDVKSIVFADISNMSNMTDEQEVLFDIGTTFIISDVTYEDTVKIWTVRMVASDEGHNIISKEYIEYYREHTKNLSATIKLGEFLTIIGRYEQARKYFNDLLRIDYMNEVHILYSLAWIDQCEGKYNEAQQKLDTAYEIEEQKDLPCQQTLRNIIMDNGSVHLSMNESIRALNCYLKADTISSSAALFNNIGLCYRQQRQWNKALEFFNKALEKDQHDWPNGHYRIGITFDNIGRNYNDQGKYKVALKFHLKGLKMKQLTLPEDHKDIGISFNNIGLTYDNLKMYDEALTNYTRALHIYQMCLPEVHRELGILLDNIAIAYRCKNQWKECFHYHQRALDVKERLNPMDLPLLIQSVHNLGVAYSESATMQNQHNDKKKAMNCFQRALSLHETNGSSQSPTAASTWYEQGRLFEFCQEYQAAFDSLIAALKIQETSLPRNHPATIKTRTVLISLKIEI